MWHLGCFAVKNKPLTDIMHIMFWFDRCFSIETLPLAIFAHVKCICPVYVCGCVGVRMHMWLVQPSLPDWCLSGSDDAASGDRDG